MTTNSSSGEIYYGDLFQDDVVEQEKEKWFGKQIKGEKVLFIGSSTLSLAIELKKEGKHVTLLNPESSLINELSLYNIEIIQEELFSLNKKYSFDCIIVDKQLEHVIRLEGYLAKVKALLSESGSILIGVSYGVNKSISQTTTVYLTNLMEEISPFFRIEELDIVGHFLLVKAIAKDVQTNGDITFKAIEIVEEAYKKIEKMLLGELNEKRKRVKEKQPETDLAGFVNIQTELLKHLTNKDNRQNEIALIESREKQLKSEFKQYESILMSAIEQRDKNLKYLRNKLTVVEQSTGFKIGSILQSSMRNPLRLPKDVYRLTRTIAGGFKRKLKGQKKKYKLVDLPYSIGNLPKSPLSDIKQNQSFEANKDLNELFLMGRYDSPRTVSELRIACILDDFSYQSFKHDGKLITFRPDNWLEVVTKELPHILFVESAWKGNSGSWQYKIAKYNTPQGEELDRLLAWCKEHNVPTVFWNKEDPIHFEKFIDTAKRFDHIYTTDENCIPRYKEASGHDNVYALPFAAQPAIHNPIKVADYKAKNICFAGSYYSNRHEDRKKDQEQILDISRPHGLDIYDRNYHLTGKGTEHFKFPERFSDNIVGSLPYTELVRAYKQYKVFLNVNSVQDSGTMFSRRVFELLACGTTVLSTYAKGIKVMFNGIVPMIDKDHSGEEELNQVLKDEGYRIKNELKGQRLVLDQHTYAHRLYQIATNCGFEVEKPYEDEVAAIAMVNSMEEVDFIYRSFAVQSHSQKKLILFSSKGLTISLNDESVEFIEIQDNDNLDKIIDELALDSTFISLFSTSNYYGEHFLKDLVQGSIYSKADIVGKGSYYELESGTLKVINEDKEYIYTDEVIVNGSIFRKEILKEYGISLMDYLTGNLSLNELTSYGVRVFSVNKYQFINNASASAEQLITEKVNL